jgi:hypothetical protein
VPLIHRFRLHLVQMIRVVQLRWLAEKHLQQA